MTSVTTALRPTAVSRTALTERFLAVRALTERLCAPLETEDYVVQTIDDVSPPKWHLGHTTWFFERVVLQAHETGFAPVDERYYFIFNSYYESFGDRILRTRRGTLSRPTVEAVRDYRHAISRRVAELIQAATDDAWSGLQSLIELGIQHEQQHQELLITDIKHILASNPLEPVYCARAATTASAREGATRWLPFAGGTYEMGAAGDGFAYDNEYPRHSVLLRDFKLAARPVTCGEYLEFMTDNGYGDHRLWLADGWDWLKREKLQHPLYWHKRDGGWQIWTLAGLRPLDRNEPVCHVSFYEASAFARWADKRLPLESEWEVAAAAVPIVPATSSFLEDETFHPVVRAGEPNDGPAVMHALFGTVWEWTASSYLPYPGYRQSRDALGEYNGKFMSNQMVLRGGSCATPRDHIRATYRNFFQCDKRWQFSGIRLADDS